MTKSLTSNAIRKLVIELSYRAGVGHIGSSLSIADILATLYRDVLRIKNPSDLDRDRFILSKGHAALALYATLYLKGWLTQKDLDTFGNDNTYLAVHPHREVTGIDFSTGSLGQGLCMGVGAALATKLNHSQRKVYVLVSDAECNEGSVWEAIMFAAHHHLSNLVVIIDLNGQQAFGYTKDVVNLQPMAEKWQSFGWHVQEVDGHDEKALVKSFTQAKSSLNKPHVVIANTTFGQGVSYMLNQIKWHYLPLSEEDYQQAMAELS